ncbi:MAG: MBL fold metallo-hydrolase [Candidatus Heimdallarchaeota archaeon]|nr:MBL fold metallo-hydrolase [Candidatus Heimdallarchaeota archaeon]
MLLEVIPGSGFCSNCFILHNKEDARVLIIDLGLPGSQTNFVLKTALEKIAETKTEKLAIEVFLTHCHIDHILGADNLQGFSQVKFSASPLAAKHINARDNVTLLSMARSSTKITYSIHQTYKDGTLISFPNTELEVIHAPGHTDGSAVIYDRRSRTLFAGDVVFAQGASGRVDLPTGNRKVLLNSLGKLAKLKIDHLYPGHGIALHQNVRENILAAKSMLESY